MQDIRVVHQAQKNVAESRKCKRIRISQEIGTLIYHLLKDAETWQKGKDFLGTLETHLHL